MKKIHRLCSTVLVDRQFYLIVRKGLRYILIYNNVKSELYDITEYIEYPINEYTFSSNLYIIMLIHGNDMWCMYRNIMKDTMNKSPKISSNVELFKVVSTNGCEYYTYDGFAIIYIKKSLTTLICYYESDIIKVMKTTPAMDATKVLPIVMKLKKDIEG